MLYQRSSQLFADAEKVIPGGVNSPVRAFKGVGGTPIFVKSAKGAYLFDEDGNKLIDYINYYIYKHISRFIFGGFLLPFNSTCSTRRHL